MEDLSVEKGRRKEMKKVSNLIGTIALAFVAFFTVNTYAEAQTTQVNSDSALRSALNTDQTIELSEDITLTSQLQITTGKNIIIDLKGHKLTGPATGYSILNEGTLTIQDTGATKGQIYCVASSSSCVVNRGTKLTVDGATLSTNYVALKNEKNELDVKNSIINLRQDFTMVDGKSTPVNRAAWGIQSYGTLKVESTTFNTPDNLVYWYSIAVEKSDSGSEATIKDVTVTGNGGHINVGQQGTGTAKFTIAGGLKKSSGMSINGYDGATIVPDAENTQLVMSRARRTSGVTIVIPDDYDGEVVLDTKAKYVTTNQTEVVFIKFQDEYYKIQKGTTWMHSAPGNSALQKALAASKTLYPEDPFIEFYIMDGGERIVVDKNYEFEKNVEIIAQYEPADYTEVNEVLDEANAKIREKKYYTTDSYNALKAAVDAVQQNYRKSQQAQVDAWVQPIKDALAGLVEKPADYTAVYAAEAEGKMVDRSLYTDDSLEALDAALALIEDGKTLRDQAEVTSWATQIRAAINSLVKKPADYSKLDKVKEDAEALDAADYTPESYGRLQAALNLVQPDMTIDNQSQVDAWEKAITDAINGLVSIYADYTEVNDLKEQVDALDRNLYTEDSLAALDAALAKVVEGKLSAEQPDVDDWADQIRTALASLKKKIDTTELEAALNAAKTMYAEATSENPEVVYTERSIKSLEKLISRVEAYLEEAVYESQDEVDALVDELEEFELIEKADYTALEELLDGIGEIDEKAYTKESLDNLYAVLGSIHGDLSVEEMKVVMANLEDAIENLELVPVKPEQKPANPDTLDNAISYVVMMIMAVVAMVIGVVARREANER